jgi:hypothetical protein
VSSEESQACRGGRGCRGSGRKSGHQGGGLRVNARRGHICAPMRAVCMDLCGLTESQALLHVMEACCELSGSR